MSAWLHMKIGFVFAIVAAAGFLPHLSLAQSSGHESKKVKQVQELAKVIFDHVYDQGEGYSTTELNAQDPFFKVLLHMSEDFAANLPPSADLVLEQIDSRTRKMLLYLIGEVNFDEIGVNLSVPVTLSLYNVDFSDAAVSERASELMRQEYEYVLKSPAFEKENFGAALFIMKTYVKRRGTVTAVDYRWIGANYQKLTEGKITNNAYAKFLEECLSEFVGIDSAPAMNILAGSEANGT
jgi:hypothetical protein